MTGDNGRKSTVDLRDIAEHNGLEGLISQLKTAKGRTKSVVEQIYVIKSLKKVDEALMSIIGNGFAHAYEENATFMKFLTSSLAYCILTGTRGKLLISSSGHGTLFFHVCAPSAPHTSPAHATSPLSRR